MYKVFYNPDTLEIKGVSDGEVSMSFPYLETDDLGVVNMQKNFAIKKNKKGKLELVCIKGYYTDEEWQELINK